MQPKYKVIIKENDIYAKYDVETLTFITNHGLPVVSATYYVGEDKKLVIIDEGTSWLYQSTNSFDKNGDTIYHGDILEQDGILHEVMYAVGSYFIVKDDAPIMLLDQNTRHLAIVGNVIQNNELLKVDTTTLEEVAQNI